MVKAVQQFQLRTVMNSEIQARETMELMKKAGYDAIELNGFMIRKMPVLVRFLTRIAGMPVGRGGKINWTELIRESGLKVVSIHEDLGSILRNTDGIIKEAEEFQTANIVVTGMHHFDYSDERAVLALTKQLNEAGKKLADAGINFLYHNHNCEFLRLIRGDHYESAREKEPGKTAFELILAETDPEYVSFEFDSYWAAEAGADVSAWMKRIGSRMKLYHINDRGSRPKGKTGSILKSDSIELGYGNMNLGEMLDQAEKNGVWAVVLESHRNWIQNSAVKSFQLSAEFLKQYERKSKS